MSENEMVSKWCQTAFLEKQKGQKPHKIKEKTIKWNNTKKNLSNLWQTVMY